MILTIRKFTVNKDNDYEKMTSKVGQLRIFLEHILSGQVPHDTYSSDDLLEFCRSLIAYQRPAEPGLAGGSWSVSPSPEEISAEDRMDYHYFPTFLALSLLVTCSSRDERVGRIPGFEEALEKGFAFTMTENLEGVGFSTLFQQVETVLILGSGGCIAWLAGHPGCCPALNRRLGELGADFRRRLSSGDTVLEFGGDFKPQFTLAAQFLKPLEG